MFTVPRKPETKILKQWKEDLYDDDTRTKIKRQSTLQSNGDSTVQEKSQTKHTESKENCEVKQKRGRQFVKYEGIGPQDDSTGVPIATRVVCTKYLF